MSVQAAGRSRRSVLGSLFRVPDVRLAFAWRLWQRNATIYRRTYKMNILPNFFEPVFYLLAMGLGVGAYLTEVEGIRYIDFIAPGLVATAALFGTSFEVTFNCFVKMEFGKVYDGVMATPLTIEDVALGELLWGTTRGFLYATVFLLVASTFGVVHSWMAVFVPLAAALVALLFSIIGLAFTAVVPLIDYFTYYWTMFLTPMFLFSGVFFPLDRSPEWLQAVAWFVPLHQGVRLIRALMLEGDVGVAVASAAWLVVATAILLVVPLNLMRHRMVK